MDYGIDGSVEIVTEDGRVSGERFYVQLKATNEVKGSRALAVRLNAETAQYYSKLQLPVLLVRYWAPRQTLLVQWFHRFDPYYGKVNAKSVTVQFTAANAWNAKTPIAIAKELDGWRWSKQREHRLPIAFTLKISGHEVNGFDAIELAGALESAMRSLADVISVSEVRSDTAMGEIEVTSVLTLVSLPPGNTCTLHTKNLPPKYALATFVADLLLLQCRSCYIGRANLAQRSGSSNLSGRNLRFWRLQKWLGLLAMRSSGQVMQLERLPMRID